MIKILSLFGLLSLLIQKIESGNDYDQNSRSLTGKTIKRNSSAGTTSTEPNSAAKSSPKPIRRNSSLQSPTRSNRESFPYPNGSASAPGTPLVRGYQTHSVRLTNCVPNRKFAEALSRSSSATEKTKHTPKYLKKSNTYPNGSGNGEKEECKPSRLTKWLNKFIKNKFEKNSSALASIDEEMPTKANSNIQQQQQQQQLATAQLGKQKKPKSHVNKLVSQSRLNEDFPGEMSFRHYSDPGGKIPSGKHQRSFSNSTAEIAKSNPKEDEQEEIPGESSFRFSPDFLQKVKVPSEDESSDKSSFGFPSPVSVPKTPEHWWRIEAQKQCEDEIAVTN